MRSATAPLYGTSVLEKLFLDISPFTLHAGAAETVERRLADRRRKDRRFGKNAFSKLFGRNPLISRDAAKEMFGKSLEKIWRLNCRSS
jgi:hypothetical protein